MSRPGVVAACCAVAFAAALAWVALTPGAAPSVQERADAVASSLRCPVCEGLSVKDSTSDVAREMRARIEAGVAAGRSEDEIKASFVEAYGESVLLTPEPEGVNLLAWAVPLLALAGGGAAAVAVVRRWTAAGGPA